LLFRYNRHQELGFPMYSGTPKGPGAVVMGGGAGGALAFTGFSVIGFTLLAVALIVLGLVLVRLALQRQTVG